MRAVVDTNVWVSAILTPSGPPGRIRAALRDARFALVISKPLMDEVADVLARPRIVRRYGVRAEDIAELVMLLRERGEHVGVTGRVRLCRDPEDDMVIETALNGRATALVTRDDDIKAASDVARLLAERGVEILTVRRFLAAIEAGELGRPNPPICRGHRGDVDHGRSTFRNGGVVRRVDGRALGAARVRLR